MDLILRIVSNFYLDELSPSLPRKLRAGWPRV